MSVSFRSTCVSNNFSSSLPDVLVLLDDVLDFLTQFVSLNCGFPSLLFSDDPTISIERKCCKENCVRILLLLSLEEEADKRARP